MDLSAPIESVKGVGPKTAEVLRRVYENYQTTVKIADLRPGKVVIRGKISDLRLVRTSRKRLTITQGVIRDDTGAIRTLWFNQPYRAKQFDEISLALMNSRVGAISSPRLAPPLSKTSSKIPRPASSRFIRLRASLSLKLFIN